MIKTYLKRFHELKRLYNCENNKKIDYANYIYNYIIYGASIRDYFMYRFFEKTHSEKMKYITCRRHIKIQKMSNNPESKKFFSDKALFNAKFEKYLKREWLDLDVCTNDQLKEFMRKNETFFLKPKNGYEGKGVEKIYSDSIGKCSDFLLNFKGKGYIIEETIHPIKELEKFCATAVNTMRITVCKNRRTNRFEMVSAVLRLGTTGSTDNIAGGGVVANIDINTGIVDENGMDLYANEYYKHPVSQKTIKGFEVPEWDKICEFVNKLNTVCPDVGYVGWDIALGENKGVLVIEGNDCADHDIQQLSAHRGFWDYYKKLLFS